MSLRARLLAGLVALVAAGLAIAGAATYAEQRSFLLARVDQQVLATVAPVSHQLGVPDARDGAPPSGDGAGGRPPPNPDGRHAPDGGPGSEALLPNGAFGERLDAGGKVLSPRLTFSYGGTAPAAPVLPHPLPVTHPGQPAHIFTASSSGGPRYRVLALASADGSGTTVVAVPLREVDQTLSRLLGVELLVAAGVILSLIVLAWFVIRVGLRPLRRMEIVAGEIASGDLSRRVSPATPRTEVGRLGLALNEMLVTIERAFADRRASEHRLRRFLADASHELRTPLASIRGYAELFRLGAADDRAELELAMSRIESEARRMGVLVEDLLTLARLDELPRRGRRVVDVGELVEQAAADARATAPDRPIAVQREPGTELEADADGLRQVIANLLRNALQHTPAGTPVEIRVHPEGQSVWLTVRDHGPGLPPGAAERVFERFWRAEAGRMRGPGGAGLGLSIVHAIVEAHRGEVRAGNAPDGGAEFSVRLPAHGPAAPEGAPAQAREGVAAETDVRT